MKNLILTFVSIFLFTQFSFAQPSTEWSQKAAPQNFTPATGTNCATDNAGSIYSIGTYSYTLIAGNKSVTAEGSNTDCAIIKYNPEGTVAWLETIGGKDSHDFITDIKTDASANIYIVGYYENNIKFEGANLKTSSGSQDAYVAKYDSTGAFQ